MRVLGLVPAAAAVEGEVRPTAWAGAPAAPREEVVEEEGPAS